MHKFIEKLGKIKVLIYQECEINYKRDISETFRAKAYHFLDMTVYMIFKALMVTVV